MSSLTRNYQAIAVQLRLKYFARVKRVFESAICYVQYLV